MINAINLSSLFLVVFITIYFWRLTANLRFEISKAIGMRITMAMAMMTGIIVGTIMGMMIMKMFLPTVIGILIGIVVGYGIGKHFGQAIIMDGMMAGIMGGMMGAMLGVMLMGDHQTYMVLFVDLIYIAMMASLWKWIHKEIVIKEKKTSEMLHTNA